MIQVQHLTKMYGPRIAISDLNFEIQKGEVVGFLGPNGAGKSTTMKILTGFMPASDGTAAIAGFDVFTHPMDVKRNVGFLPETPPVYPEMRVEDYLIFAAELHQVSKGSIKQATDLTLQKTGLGDVRKRLIGNLSKGFRQRVGLAQALIHNPQVLILDEPTVGLDPKQIIEIRELIKSLAGDHTVILSSHILPEVTATCQRIIVINQGRIVAEDTIDHLTTRLKKGLIYNLFVKNPSTEGITALRKIAGIKDVSIPSGPTGLGKVVIEIAPNTSELRDQIVETAVNQRMGVLEFSVERVSLEDVFLQLTTIETPSESTGV